MTMTVHCRSGMCWNVRGEQLRSQRRSLGPRPKDIIRLVGEIHRNNLGVPVAGQFRCRNNFMTKFVTFWQVRCRAGH